MQHQIDQIRQDSSDGDAGDPVDEGEKINNTSEAGDNNQDSKILNIIQSDLSFLIPLLRKFPKCYWLWNYRLWLLSLATSTLPPSTSHTLWQHELALVGKMLTLDSRNFHGWGYRRTVVAALEKDQTITEKKSMAEQEFDYTTKMIGSNLSNFSAWHNRSKLIPKMLDERKASKEERRELLDAELKMIERALYADAEDQSLWFYHQYLVCAFSHEERYTKQSIVPDLLNEERIEYLSKEIESLVEMLDGAEDCKWIYQRLIELCVMHYELAKSWAGSIDKAKVLEWVEELKKLDPLRRGRWLDLEASIRQNHGE